MDSHRAGLTRLICGCAKLVAPFSALGPHAPKILRAELWVRDGLLEDPKPVLTTLEHDPTNLVEYAACSHSLLQFLSTCGPLKPGPKSATLGFRFQIDSYVYNIRLYS